MIRSLTSNEKVVGLYPPQEFINTSYDSGTSTLETYYSNFVARQLYTQVPEVQEESTLATPQSNLLQYNWAQVINFFFF